MSRTRFLTGRRTLAAGTVAAAFLLVGSPAHADSSSELPVPAAMPGTGALASETGAGQGAAVLRTPSGMPPWMVPAGLATMLTGAVVVRSARQKAALI